MPPRGCLFEENVAMVHEVVIIGSGPAGLTAGIYLGRFKRKPLIIDGNLPGGQMMTTGAVENWPGEISIEGPALMKQIREHAQNVGATFLGDSVTKVDFEKHPFELQTKSSGVLQAKSVIIATGSAPRKLGCPGEDEYWGKGVNVCATCDAPLYEGKEVVVVGGGNSAIAESFALSKFAKKVTIMQILDSLTATDPLMDKALAQPNVEVLYNKRVVEIKGDGETVSGVVVEDQKDKSVSEYPAQGVFIAIGMLPSSKVFEGAIELDERGHIMRSAGLHTSVEGVLVAGDVTDSRYCQAITASGQGCAAALECEDFLISISE